MGDTVRFGVSIDSELLKHFDRLISRKKYGSRSEAIRDLIRVELVELEWSEDGAESLGTITLVYSHEARELSDRLIDLQHRMEGLIVSTLHIHLDKHNCLEVLVVRGKTGNIRSAADQLISTKGVKHGKLTMATAGKHLA
jgi:CopG family nickel-responsive transcriptional regulator